MIDKLRELHGYRVLLDLASSTWKETQARFQEEHKAEREARDSIASKVVLIAGQIREVAISTFAETGNKAPYPGVGIREREVLEFDKTKAFDWALEHRLALSLDSKAFEKIMKANKVLPDFVALKVEPQATIATDLSPYIQPEGKN